MLKSITYKEAGVLVCDSCGEALNKCYSCVEEIKDNDRILHQARALNKIISSQREMINISRPIILHSSQIKWRKKFKKEEEQKENPFEEFDLDYKKLMDWRDFLIECAKAIRFADETPSKDDDFMITRTNNEGDEVNFLTDNFHDMLEDLELSFEQIYLLMLTNKIVSAGIEEDEELSYKEKEQEAIRRVVEA